MQIWRTQWFWFFLISCVSRASSTSLDSITPTRPLKFGDNKTLVSQEKTFEFGFFSPGNSKNNYLGIWYYNRFPQTVVWVANRESPLNTTSGVLKFNDQGVLVLLDDRNIALWSSNNSKTAEKPVAQLLDSGNLVVKDENIKQGEYLWQSFDHPCDTLLSEMKIGWNLRNAEERFLSSWKSNVDPGQGNCTFRIDRRGYPQAVLMDGGEIITRFGPWNGFHFSGSLIDSRSGIAQIDFVANETEIYYEYRILNKSLSYKFMVDTNQRAVVSLWENQKGAWRNFYTQPASDCENYRTCGANKICSNVSNKKCTCLEGFSAHTDESTADCARTIPLTGTKDSFKKYTGVVLPDTRSSWYHKDMVLEKCKSLCLENINCTAYAKLDIRDGGRDCLHWFHDLIDLRNFPDAKAGHDIYIRYPPSEKDDNQKSGLSKGKINAIIIGSTVFAMCVLLGLAILFWKKKVKKEGMNKEVSVSHHNYKLRKEDSGLSAFDLPVIAEATDNFSDTHRLGEGGFGPVYKGTLIDGQEIAVKRLSKSSGQGLEEFKNEVALIAKLQHRNLVKLHGYCIEEGEKILIYEYMPNNSLDNFIFDENKRKLLDWRMRFNIIGGIARGLMYLHHDSRLRIIHRDLKTSNILLDENMNSKISDFGLARTLWGDQEDANTNKVAGTYGYMPPEYVVHGHFSMKSDVFSFGVIVLEIVSGRRNRGFSDPENLVNLLGHAWRLWNEGRPTDLIDDFFSERCTSSEVIRCIHVGLLCVQQRPEDRPDMSVVVLMLNGDKMLPQPRAPGFYDGWDKVESSGKSEQFSNNDVSVTVLEAR